MNELTFSYIIQSAIAVALSIRFLLNIRHIRMFSSNVAEFKEYLELFNLRPVYISRQIPQGVDTIEMKFLSLVQDYDVYPELQVSRSDIFQSDPPRWRTARLLVLYNPIFLRCKLVLQVRDFTAFSLILPVHHLTHNPFLDNG